MRLTSNINFYCRESKVNKQGLAPIELSIILNGKRTYISTPLKVSPTTFNKKRKPKELVEYIEQYRALITKAEIDLLANNITITTDTLKEYIINGSVHKDKLFDLCDKFLSYQKTRIDVNFDASQYTKYELVVKDIKEFFGNIDLDTITNDMALRYRTHLLKQFQSSTAVGYLTKTKTLFSYAIKNNITNNNQFSELSIKREDKDIVYLTKEEIDKLRNKDFGIERLNRIRDISLFQASTGMAYIDLISITKDDIKKDDNNTYYIIKRREKTNVEFISVILPIGIEILKKYNYNIPTLTNQRYNSYLKEISDILGINKNITTHTLRKTYACLLLQNGVNMEVVAKCLGHTNTNTTRKYYATLTKTNIIDEVKKIF